MSPEQSAGKRPSYASDVYSVGVVLWEIVSSQIPYEHIENDYVIINTIEKGTTEELPEDMPEDYAAIIKSCWSLDPKHRPTADALAKSLIALRSG